MNEDVNQVDCLRESSPTSMFECTRKIILNSIWQFLVLNEDSKFNHNNDNFVETFNFQSLWQSLLVVVMQLSALQMLCQYYYFCQFLWKF